MKYVIDCSVGFKMLVAETHTPKALALRDDFQKAVHELLAPDFLPIELSNALIVSERKRRIQKGDAAILLKDFLTTPPDFHPTFPDLLPRAHAIAESTVASVYDSLYVALAEREGCELVTADDKLIKNLQAQFKFIIHLTAVP